MYKKTRKKIIVLIMVLLLLLWSATLAIIYFTTYGAAATESRDMMELYASVYEKNGRPNEPELPRKETPRRLQVSKFYSVAFKTDETEITNDKPSPFTDEELVEMAAYFQQQGKEFEVTDNVIYLVCEEESYTLVVIMDNTVVGETMNALVHNMIFYGATAVVVLCVVDLILSKLIFRPREENDNKQKQFISDAGHELKTPISTINANMEILQREIGDNAWLSNIRYENNRMEIIVKQLLDLAKIQDAKVENEDIDLSRVILSQILPFEATVYEKGMKLQIDISERIHMIGNVNHMQMLASVLLDNAVSHSDKGKVIRINLHSSHHGALFTIANQGEQIPEEDQKRIFDRFYRSDVVRSGDENHYGLGLAIAKSIVQSFKGKIYVTCDDGWIRFCVEIPGL